MKRHMYSPQCSLEALGSWIFLVENGHQKHFQEKFGVRRLVSALLALDLSSAQGASKLIL